MGDNPSSFVKLSLSQPARSMINDIIFMAVVVCYIFKDILILNY